MREPNTLMSQCEIVFKKVALRYFHNQTITISSNRGQIVINCVPLACLQSRLPIKTNHLSTLLTLIATFETRLRQNGFIDLMTITWNETLVFVQKTKGHQISLKWFLHFGISYILWRGSSYIFKLWFIWKLFRIWKHTQNPFSCIKIAMSKQLTKCETLRKSHFSILPSTFLPTPNL